MYCGPLTDPPPEGTAASDGSCCRPGTPCSTPVSRRARLASRVSTHPFSVETPLLLLLPLGALPATWAWGQRQPAASVTATGSLCGHGCSVYHASCATRRERGAFIACSVRLHTSATEAGGIESIPRTRGCVHARSGSRPSRQGARPCRKQDKQFTRPRPGRESEGQRKLGTRAGSDHGWGGGTRPPDFRRRLPVTKERHTVACAKWRLVKSVSPIELQRNVLTSFPFRQSTRPTAAGTRPTKQLCSKPGKLLIINTKRAISKNDNDVG